MSIQSMFARLLGRKSTAQSAFKGGDLSRTLSFVIKIFYLMVLFYVITLAYCGYLALQITQLRDSSQALSNLNTSVMQLKNELTSNFLLNPDSMQHYMTEGGEHEPENQAAVSIKKLLKDPQLLAVKSSKDAVVAIDTNFKNYQASFKKIVEVQTQQAQMGEAQSTVGPGLELLSHASEAGTSLARIEEAADTLDKKIKVNRDRLMRMLWTGIILGSLSLVATLLGLGILISSTRKKANEAMVSHAVAAREAEAENENINNSAILLMQAVSQIADRDLTVRAPVTQDVIGTLSDSINVLAEETTRVLQGVSDVAAQVKHVSGNVRAQAQLVADTAQTERERVNSMVESLYGATQAMNEVATMAEKSNISAGQATQVTQNALETVNAAVEGMESIRETIAETEKRIKRLGERSQEISGIVNLINTIAERTHVLALNAAMQAAVAGEAGRGFAVVAEEVQRLAESSRNATQQIATLVNNIQIETNETINTVNRTIGQVVQGSEQAQKAGEQMRRTQEITTELVSHVRNIAQASEEQKVMSNQLLSSVHQIGESTEQTARQIQAQNIETELLQDAARQLVESVGVFKLTPDNDVPEGVSY